MRLRTGFSEPRKSVPCEPPFRRSPMLAGSAPDMTTVSMPDIVAIDAASIFVDMPPVPSPETLPPAMARISSVISGTT